MAAYEIVKVLIGTKYIFLTNLFLFSNVFLKQFSLLHRLIIKQYS